jgi:parallel beta-helix repeat protein
MSIPDLIPPFSPEIGPVPNITPFTYRDGRTYLDKLAGLVYWANNSLVPQMNEAVEIVINDGIQLQDPVMAGIMNIPDSNTRLTTDDIYTLAYLAPRATGANQLTELQNAIDTAAINGMSLALRGDYIIAGELNVPSNMTIDGSNATITQTSDLQSIFRLNNVTNVHITHVKAFGKQSDYVNSSNVYRAAAVYCAGETNDVIVDFCDFRNFAGAGVYAAGTCTDITIQRNKLGGPGSDYILNTTYNYGAGIVIMDGLHNWNAIENEIFDWSQGIVTGHSANKFRVIGNYIHDIVGQHGMYFRAVSEGVISNNLVVNIALQGMKIQVTETGTAVVSIDISITSNTFKNVGVHGILFASTVAILVTKISVTSNTIDGSTGDGIVLDGAYVQGITLVANHISNTNYGIRSNGASYNQIVNNDIENVARTGIHLVGGTGNKVMGNNVKNVGSAEDIAANNGISFSTVLDTTVISNKVTSPNGKMRYAYYVLTGAISELIFADNEGRDATQYGYRGIAGDAKMFRGNKFSGTVGSVVTPPTNYPAISDSTGGTVTSLETRLNQLYSVLRTNNIIR